MRAFCDAIGGDRDPVTSIAASEEIVNALARNVGQFEVMPNAGHFPWLDAPDRFDEILTRFVAFGSGG